MTPQEARAEKAEAEVERLKAPCPVCGQRVTAEVLMNLHLIEHPMSKKDWERVERRVNPSGEPLGGSGRESGLSLSTEKASGKTDAARRVATAHEGYIYLRTFEASKKG